MVASGFGMSFRGRLKRELPRWVELGLVDATTAGKLREHYKLDVSGAGAAIIAAYVLGVLLIGGGVISLVAYNWEAIPDALKLLLVGGMMVGAHVVGFRWWKLNKNRPRLGHALAFLGTLLLGANIGLAAQIFNVSSDGGTGIGLWAFGALVAAWLYDSGPTAAASLVLADFWAAGFGDRHQDIAPALGLSFAVIYFFLVWRLRSRLLFTAVLVGVSICLGIGISAAGRDADVILFLILLAALLAVWSLAVRSDTGLRFAPIARALGILGVAIAAYLLSFHDLARETEEIGEKLEGLVAMVPIGFAIVGLAAWSLATHARAWREHRVTATAASGGVLLAIATLLPDQEVTVTLIANLTVVALATAAIVVSVRSLERLPFWSGSLLAALTILSRFLEIETELWVKGLAFILCGTAVLWVGVSFERKLKLKGGAHAA